MNYEGIYSQLTPAERSLLLGAKARGGEILDNTYWAPDCGTLVAQGLVGKYEVALTQEGHDLADWVNETYPWACDFEHFRSRLRCDP